MTRFLSLVAAFILATGVAFLLILSLADGYTDPFYLRFTTPRQPNLILGSSRAAQGVQPQILNLILGQEIFNYAFTVSHSPYGETYLESIKKKIEKREARDGVFLVTVDPWSISSEGLNPNDPSTFREADLCLGNTPYVNQDPNYFYLLKNLKGDFYTVLNPLKSQMLLHEDGWLEVNVDMDEDQVKQRISEKINTYRKNYLAKYAFSDLRWFYLRKTIEFLAQYGDVYLVRLPVHPEMVKIEDEFMSTFNEKVYSLTDVAKGYYDMTPEGDKYKYTDGNHLYKESGKEVSAAIGQWIESIRTN